MGRTLLSLGFVWALVACGESAAPTTVTAPSSTPTPTPTTPATPTPTTPATPTPTPTPTLGSFELVAQRVHRSVGATYEDPRGRYSLYWSRRVVAIHEPHLGRVRSSFAHGVSGTVFWARFWPTLDPDVVLASAAAGGDPFPRDASRLFLVHPSTGDVAEVRPAGWWGALDPTPMGPNRVLAGASVVDLGSAHVRELDLSATDAEAAAVAESGGELPDPAESPVGDARLSHDRHRLAILQLSGRIVLFDAVSLRRTAVLGALPDHVSDVEAYEAGGPRSMTWVVGSDRLVTADEGGAPITVALDGTIAPLAVPEELRGAWFEGLDEAPARIRFTESGRVFSVETGEEVEVPASPEAEDPDDEEGWDPGAWTGTADPELSERAADVPASGGGERAIWNVAFAPGDPLAVIAGRGGAYRFSREGAARIPCLAGVWPLDFDSRGHVLEPESGDCDVRTGAGVAGTSPDPEFGNFDPDCGALAAHGGEGGDDRYTLFSSWGTPGGPDDVESWDGVTFEPCDGSEPWELDDAAGIDPTRAALSPHHAILVAPVEDAGTRVWDVDRGTVVTTVEGGAQLVGLSTHGRTVFLRRERDAHLLLVAREGGRVRVDAGPAPSLGCEPTPIAQQPGVIALHLESGIRLLDSTSLAVRAEIAIAGVCGMELTRERVLVRRGDEILSFGLDGAPASTIAVPPGFHASTDGSAVVRCEAGVLEVRSTSDGAVIGGWEGDCDELVFSDDARFVLTRDVGRTRARIVRVADRRSLVVGMIDDGGRLRGFAFDPATGVFFADDDAPHALFAVRLGARVLDDVLVSGDEAWSRFRRASLVADFFEGRPLPTASGP